MMGLNSQGRGRIRGNTGNFRRGAHNGVGIVSERPMFMPAPSGLVYPPTGFPSKPPFGNPTIFGPPPRFSSQPQRHAFGKFRGKYFMKNVKTGYNESRVLEVDLTKPWVTEEIRNEDTKRRAIFQTWKENKSPENWSKYKAQNLTVQTLYAKAIAEYAANHPDEAVLHEKTSTVKNYFCETCDKSFRTSDDLFLHEAEHETCGREGCEFTAHPKIISKHIKMQHESGLFKRIGKFYTEEDIAKWIEERKKRYPTRKVVEEKKILEQEKLKRGERIKDDDSKFNKSFSNKSKRSVKKNFEKRATKNRRTRKKKVVSVVEKYIEEEASAIRKGVPAFLGIKTVDEVVTTEKKDFNISDDEWETEHKSQTVAKPLLNGSLGLLAAFYDSDEENEKELHNEVKVEPMSADEGSGPEEVSSKNAVPEENVIKEKVFLKKKSSGRKGIRERKSQNVFGDINFEKRNLTLLEKLLKNEIRHERNVILQCVHYVVKNNFFKV